MFRKPLWVVIFVLALALIACKATSSSQPERTTETATITGEQTFQRLGCSECHVKAAGQAAPSLQGLFGAEVHLENGDTITADEDYLRESILSPNAKVVRGYQPIMPASFQEQITEEQLAALIEYIQSLSN